MSDKIKTTAKKSESFILKVSQSQKRISVCYLSDILNVAVRFASIFIFLFRQLLNYLE